MGTNWPRLAVVTLAFAGCSGLSSEYSAEGTALRVGIAPPGGIVERGSDPGFEVTAAAESGIPIDRVTVAATWLDGAGAPQDQIPLEPDDSGRYSLGDSLAIGDASQPIEITATAWAADGSSGSTTEKFTIDPVDWSDEAIQGETTSSVFEIVQPTVSIQGRVAFGMRVDLRDAIGGDLVRVGGVRLAIDLGSSEFVLTSADPAESSVRVALVADEQSSVALIFEPEVVKFDVFGATVGEVRHGLTPGMDYQVEVLGALAKVRCVGIDPAAELDSSDDCPAGAEFSLVDDGERIGPDYQEGSLRATVVPGSVIRGAR